MLLLPHAALVTSSVPTFDLSLPVVATPTAAASATDDASIQLQLLAIGTGGVSGVRRLGKLDVLLNDESSLTVLE